jgi:hypothetical protein
MYGIWLHHIPNFFLSLGVFSGLNIVVNYAKRNIPKLIGLKPLLTLTVSRARKLGAAQFHSSGLGSLLRLKFRFHPMPQSPEGLTEAAELPGRCSLTWLWVAAGCGWLLSVGGREASIPLHMSLSAQVPCPYDRVLACIEIVIQERGERAWKKLAFSWLASEVSQYHIYLLEESH